MQTYLPSIEEFAKDVVDKPALGKTSLQQDPDVTVVTVCYNPLQAGRHTLFAKNLDSVQKQKGITLEHLIIDGASTDGTIEFLAQFKNKYHDIRILSRKDSGIYEAMNRGIALARGKYVVFLNTDDFYHYPGGLAVSVMALEESGCSYSFAPILAKKSHGVSCRKPHYRLHKFFVFCVVRHPSMLFCRKDIIEIGGFDQTYRLAADYDIMLRLTAAGKKACFVNCCFVTFVEGGFAMQNKSLNIKEKSKIIKNIHHEIWGIDLSDQEAEYIVCKCKYPRKYIAVYVESQKLISQAFTGLPKSFVYTLLRRLNFIKYYLKCILS